MRYLIQEPMPPQDGHAPSTVPRTLVQFWDDPVIPPDVRACMDSWRALEKSGFELVIFHDKEAEAYIAEHFGRRYLAAFRRCRHPAMRCDYFRLCFISRNGGFYVDADEVYQGGDCEYLFSDDRLKLQPLCYDPATDTMVSAQIFTRDQSDSRDWILYVANDPLIAPPRHPVIRLALDRATNRLLSASSVRPEIQSTTGPGNLTSSLVEHAINSARAGRVRDFTILPNWRSTSVTEWSLSYREDARNWRLWSQSC
jgi:mannosyltransferase OCH1-like enzyme